MAMNREEFEVSARETIEKTVRSVQNWLERGLKRVLMPLISQFLGKKSPVKDIKLGVGNVSYTDMRSIVVSLTEEEACCLTKTEQATVIKFKTYHELSHVRWTNDSEYREGIQLIGDTINEYAEKQGLVMLGQPLFNLGADLMNSLEDGRIENLLCLTFPGLKKHRDWYRLSQWKRFDVLDPRYNPSKYTELRNAILDVATMGILPQNFTVKFPTSGNFCKTVLSLCGDIANFVTSNTIKNGLPYVEAVAKAIAPYVVEEYGLTEEEYEELRKGHNSKYSEEDLRKIAEQAAKEARNHAGREPLEGQPAPQNGPIVSVLTDDDETEGEAGQPGVRPDVVVDLRKNPPKAEGNDNNDGDNPYYYRPDELDEDSDEEDEDNSQSSPSSGKSKDENGENGESSQSSSENGSSSETPSSSESGESRGEGSADETSDSSNGSSSSGESMDEDGEDGELSESNQSSSNSSTNSQNSKMESRENEEGESKGGSDGYQLPDPEDFTKKVGEALDKADGDLSSEILSEVRRANKEESSWEKAEESAFPLSREKVSCLASEFGGREVSVRDYRVNPVADTPCPSDIQAKGRRLASKIDKIIKAKSSPARRDCRTGLVDTTNLGKFVSGQTDFYRQDAVNKPVDIACMVLKDDSGSMSGENEETAVETLAEIEECFKKLDKNIKLRMQAFSTYDGETLKVIKDFDDTNKSKSYTYSFHRQSNPNGGNNDAYSIALATDILAARKEKSKLLIVVSDGAPCCSTELVKKAVNRARSMGIFVISILIGRRECIEDNWNTFQSMYEQNLLAGSLDNMGDQLFRFIKKFVASL